MMALATRPSPTTEIPQGLVGWWLEELRGLLPRRRFGRGAGAGGSARGPGLMLLLEGGQIRVLQRGRRGGGGGPETLGSFPLPEARAGSAAPASGDPDGLLVAEPGLRRALVRRSGQLRLVLGEQDSIVCSDVLPASAERDLDRIMAHKVDLLTPWPAEQVHAAQRVAQRHRDGMLEVLLAVAPRRIVDEAQRRLAGAGITVAAVDVALDAAGTPAGVDLLEAEAPRRSRRRFSVARVLVALLVAAALAGASWAGWQIWLRHQRIAAREMVAAGLEQRLADLPALRGRIDALQAEARFLADERRSRPSPLVVLEVLSRALPDSVWLTDVAMENREIILSGLAEDASGLIALIEGLPEFEQVRFNTPSTRVKVPAADGGEREVDRFAIRAVIDPAAEPEL